MLLSERQYSALTALLVLVALGLLYWKLALVGGIEHAIVTPEGVRIESLEQSDPVAQLKAYRPLSEVFVSPVFAQNGPDNSFYANASNLALLVIAGNADKNVIQLYRQTDLAGDLAGCTTNWGNPKTVAELSAADCDALLGRDDALFFLIDEIDFSGSEDVVRLKGSTIRVQANSKASLNRSVFSVLKGIYPNAEKTLSASNQFALSQLNTKN